MICKHHKHDISWCMICYYESIGLDYYKLKDDYLKTIGTSYHFMRKFQKKKKNGDYDLEGFEK